MCWCIFQLAINSLIGKKISLIIIQGQQGLSGHFEMALTGRKKVAMSKLMIASNSQRRHIFKYMVSFHLTIKPWPQQPHKVQVY